MTDKELMQQALDALEYASDMTKPENMSGCECPICVTITALRDRLAQPKQEPVAWSYWQSCLNDDGTQTAPWVHRLSKFKPSESIINKEVVPLYTTPPQRPWVGLTGEEVKEIIDRYTIDDHGFDIWCDGLGVVKAVDDKLRSKNT